METGSKNLMSGLLGIIPRGSHSHFYPLITRPVCFDCGEGKSIYFVYWFKAYTCYCKVGPSFSLCCFPAGSTTEFAVGHSSFQSSQVPLGDGVLTDEQI